MCALCCKCLEREILLFVFVVSSVCLPQILLPLLLRLQEPGQCPTAHELHCTFLPSGLWLSSTFEVRGVRRVRAHLSPSPHAIREHPLGSGQSLPLLGWSTAQACGSLPSSVRQANCASIKLLPARS